MPAPATMRLPAMCLPSTCRRCAGRQCRSVGLLGIETGLPQGPAEVRLAWRGRPETCTAGGIMHGGALMALADTAGGMLAFLNLPDGAAGTTTTDSTTRFVAAVRDGYAEAVARVLHKGRTLIVVDTEIRRRRRAPGGPDVAGAAGADASLMAVPCRGNLEPR